MSKKNEYAFPWAAACGGQMRWENGMTLRDYFAGQALIGLLADPQIQADNKRIAYIYTASYDIADAMIAARDGKGE